MATIHLSGVSRSFVIGGQSLTVLDDVNLDVPGGSVVAVVGPNGSG